MQASSIISRVIAVNLVIPQLPQTFQNTPPITMADLLQIVSFWHKNMANLPQAVDFGHGNFLTSILNQLDVL